MITVTNDFKVANNAQTRQYSSRLTLNVPTFISGVYLNDRIIRFNIVEEFTTLSDTLPSDTCSVTLDNADGTFNFLNFSNMTKILASKPTMFIELGLTIPTGVEWIPAGYFFMDNWKIDPSMKTVTLVGQDWLSLLSNFYLAPGNYLNMNAVITSIFSTSGITNFSIDSAITNAIYHTPKKIVKEMDCRAALQHAAVATNSAVYQDRTGKMIVKPFPTLATQGAFTLYVTGQTRIFQYATSQYGVYQEIDDDAGNRRISLANMYDLPSVELQKSIYQMKISVYDSSTGTVGHDNMYTNTGLSGGTNGVAFAVDNPLIDSDAMAVKVADFYFSESNYNALYTCQWRQNPSIMCGDIVLVDDGQTIGGVPQSSNKISRVVKQEFVYEGALSGTSEVRGGV